MRFAVTAKYKKFCSQFEDCSEFAIMDVQDNKIVSENFWISPCHKQGKVPEWLHSEMKVNIVISGNISLQTEHLLADKGILVVVGSMVESPRNVLEKHLNGDVEAGAGNL